MTELRRANGLDASVPRLHKQLSVRGVGQHPHPHPLLHSLADHGCNLSSGGNSAASTTSSSTATATTALGGGGASSGGGVGGLGGLGSTQRSVEFDEHDIFYVSPSKRKGADGGVPANGSLVAPPGSGGNSNSNHNVVTFSNFVSEQRVTPASSHRGSLKRSKGRSNQSLCSCDAGDEAQLQLQPDAAARPLFEYSLERRRKTHTYSCEQNAQILMRLERERNRKLSLTLPGSAIEMGMGMGAGTATGALVDLQCDTPSLSDVDIIPPVPPPPAMKRNGSMRSLRLLQHLQQQQQQNQQQLTFSGSHNNNLAQLCSSDLLQECTKSALDECTATLLQCTTTSTANQSSSNSNSSSSHCNNNNNAKPDICHTHSHSHGHNHSHNQSQAQSQSQSLSKPQSKHAPNPPFAAHEEDEIFTPHSKKSDPSLCFLPPATAAAGNGSAASKYNTIGPSSDYARHLAHYSRYLQKQHQQQQLAHFQQQRCRCFSQSLLNFPQQQQQQQQGAQQQQQQQQQHTLPLQQQPAIFHTSSMDWTLPINSRSFGNLVNIEGSAIGGGCRVPYQKMPPHQGAGSGGALAASTFTMTSFDSDIGIGIGHGLKERESQTSLHQQAQPHTHPHPHPHSHSHPHHYHAHHAVVGGSGSGSVTPQKHHQLHSSVTSIMPWKHRQCPSRGSSSSGTNSFRFDAAKHWLAVSSILLIIGAASVAVPLALRVAASAPFEERLRVAVQLLDQVPLIDGHNDLPWNIRKFLHNKLNDFNFDEDLRNVMPWGRSHWSHTDLTRLKKGRISAQFWAAYVPCEAQHRDAVQLTLEQIDVIKRLTDRYSPQLTTCTSAQDIIDAHKNQQVCSLTGVEGGHSLGGSLAVLRTLYAIGVRYMTLTSTCHTPWADSSYADAPTFNMKHGGLTLFGKTIIREMNRLGMMVDLSHVSKGTMRDALEVSEAPVIFSHSSAYELCNTSRNVQDDILQSLAKNGGLVMVNFYSKFLSCSDNSTVHDAVAHINHIKRVAGIDHVGLGAGYDGINYTPKGLEDVSSYPTLFAELLGGGWTMDELTKLAGGNFLRVMQQVEKLRDDKKTAGVKPYEDHPNFRTDDPYNCTSS
ncbi:protein naked cuticle [Drosophila persimilis]|uniref:protein naked cuticle n=1 Tax=Drosophila persimilis TaxID=7234 RepID=UPI000F082CD9|nr:protein naked cuticle [Drosophila persimilis]